MRRILSLFLMLCLACTYHLAGADAVVTPSEPDPDAQGWIAAQNADGSEGRIYGDLETLIGLCGEGEIFVQAKKAVKISEIDARQLIGVEFAPDPDVFQNGEFRARITTESPDAAEDLSALEDIDLSGFDTSKVTDMDYMFFLCTGIGVDDVRHFDTSKVVEHKNFMSQGNWQSLFEN